MASISGFWTVPNNQFQKDGMPTLRGALAGPAIFLPKRRPPGISRTTDLMCRFFQVLKIMQVLYVLQALSVYVFPLSSKDEISP